MKCTNCNVSVSKDALYCPNCGAKVEIKEEKQTKNEEKKENEVTVIEPVKTTTQSSSNSFWWGVLGFFIPLAGLILFLVWKTERPSDSKAAGIGALISVCINIFITFITIFFIFVGIFSAASYY